MHSAHVPAGDRQPANGSVTMAIDPPTGGAVVVVGQMRVGEGALVIIGYHPAPTIPRRPAVMTPGCQPVTLHWPPFPTHPPHHIRVRLTATPPPKHQHV